MKVPFLDLGVQYRSIRGEVLEALEAVLERGAFAGGAFVERFEEEFAGYCDNAYAVGLGSGTEALWLALAAAGIGEGDEVITVPNSFIATAEAISMTGARPVFVDVEEDTQNMDPLALEEAVTSRTRAVVPVHLFGHPAPMDAIGEVARRRGLFLLEDACQAHGALYRGRRAGSLGHAAAFSFYPGKNLGAYGDAGALVTGDRALAEKVRMLRDHGQAEKHRHRLVGWNARMDGFQGAVLSVKLRHLEGWIEARRSRASRYLQRLVGVEGLELPGEAPWARHVWHIFPVRVMDRDRLLQELPRLGVGCSVHYPVPIHRQEAYRHLELPEGSYPRAENSAARYLSLPIYPELSDEQLDYVCERLVQSLGQ